MQLHWRQSKHDCAYTEHTLHCSVQSDCFLYMFTKMKHLIFFFHLYKEVFYFFSFTKKSSAGNKILHCILLRKGEIRPNFRRYWHLCILIKNTYKTHFHWETNKATIYFSLARVYYFFFYIVVLLKVFWAGTCTETDWNFHARLGFSVSLQHHSHLLHFGYFKKSSLAIPFKNCVWFNK